MSKKVKYYQQYDLGIQLIDIHLIEMKAYSHTKTFFYTNIHGNFICNCPKLEII